MCFVTESDDDMIEEALTVNITLLGMYLISDSTQVLHRGEMEAFKKDYEEYQEKFRQVVVRKIEYIGNSVEDTLLGVRQMSLSAPWIVYGPHFVDFGEEFKGRPFVWVASGPSLDKNVHLLKEDDRLRKCVVVCADTACRKLLKNGIVPHIVICIERVIEMYTYYLRHVVEEFPEEAKNIVLVASAVCVPQLIGRWPGPVMVPGKTEIPIDRWYIGPLLGGDLVYGGASVSHMALALIASRDASSLALIGQDLSFGEDSRSHASDTADAADMKLEQSHDARPRLLVPAASGEGDVETHEIWLMMIRIFEQMLSECPVPVYDCTEGGALIEGTTVRPFADYLNEFVDEVEPMGDTPSAMVYKSYSPKANLWRGEVALGRLQKAFDDLEKAEGILKKIEDGITRFSAPGLAPVRRQLLAADVSGDFDVLHRVDPSLAFMGQSYTTVSGYAIARSRNLETIEEIEELRDTYQSVVDSHRLNVNFTRQWIRYAIPALETYARRIEAMEDDSQNPFGVLGDEFAREEAEKRLAALAGEAESTEALLAEQIALDGVFARSDPAFHSWPADTLWKLALALEGEGRCAEGNMLMNEAGEQYYGTEMPVDKIVAFLKDAARIAASNDLCYFPQYDRAKILLDNALELAPDDASIREQLKALMASVGVFYDDATALSLGSGPKDWLRDRIEVERYLYANKLDKAVLALWEMIKKYADQYPDLCQPVGGWLLHTIHTCWHAQDESFQAAFRKIAAEVAERIELIQRLKIPMTVGFLGILREQGVNFDFELLPEETAEAQEAEQAEDPSNVEVEAP